MLDIGLLNNSASGRLIRHVMLAFAEFERGLILQRTREGKEFARVKDGYQEGRPKKYTDTELKHAISLLKARNTYRAVSESTGISISTLSRTKRHMGRLQNNIMD